MTFGDYSGKKVLHSILETKVDEGLGTNVMYCRQPFQYMLHSGPVSGPCVDLQLEIPKCFERAGSKKWVGRPLVRNPALPK